MDKRPIGLFDSGIGGLSVLKELLNTLPHENYVYLGDTKNFPYGNKTKESIIELTKKNIEFLIKKNVKLIIIACGTATSQALETVINMYPIPIIGIIDPTVSYLKDTHKDKEKIGIIATKGTIKSGMWEKKIKECIHNVDIISEKAPLLAIMAEEGWTNNKIAKYTIKEYMKTFKKVDKLVLGCTHYPFFKELIHDELPNVELIDAGIIIAKYLKKYLQDNKLQNNIKNNHFQIYLSDYDEEFELLAQKFLDNNHIKIKNSSI